jgi:hypothetical protein
MARRYPPTPVAARRLVWLSRALSGLAFVLGLYFGALAMSRDQDVLAMLFLAISAAYVLATWANPASPLIWVAIGGIVTILVILDPNVLTVTLAVAAGALFWLRGRKQITRVNTSTIRPVADDAIMTGAERFVSELAELGWRQAGAYEFDSRSATVTASVLVHPELDRHAEITDMVFAIESRFEDGLILITMSSARAGLPPNYLANIVFGATPAELADAHQNALDLLATFDVAPLRVPEHTIVSEAMASEVETIEWSVRHPTGGLFNFGTGPGPLDDSQRSRLRIKDWLASVPE